MPSDLKGLAFEMRFPSNKQAALCSINFEAANHLELVNVFMWLGLSPRGDGVEERAAVRQGFAAAGGRMYNICDWIHSVEGQFLYKRGGICRSDNIFYYTI